MTTTKPNRLQKHVLLVDDNQKFIELFKIQIDQIGFNIKVDYASSLQDARCFFNTKFDILVVDYNLGNGVTGADIITMYKVKFPYVRSILYSKDPIEGDCSCVDKLIEAQDVDSIIDSIKIYCVNEIEPQILETIFNEINKIKSKLAALEAAVNSINELKQTISSVETKVADFIKEHKNDAYKIIGAFAALEALRALWEKFFTN